MRGASQAVSELRGFISGWLTPKGFQPDPHGSAHASYRGAIGGRSVSVHASAKTRSRQGSGGRSFAGYHLEIVADTAVMTRMVAERGSGLVGRLAARLLRWRGLERVTLPDEEPAAVRFWALELSWARSYLSDPSVEGIFERIGVSTPNQSITFRMAPGKLALSTPFEAKEVHDGTADLWLEAAADLAGLAEAWPAPASPATFTWFEKKHQENPRRAVWLLASLLILGPAFALFMGTGIVLGVFYLVGGSDAVALSLIGFAALFMPVAMFLAIRNLWRGLKGRRA